MKTETGQDISKTEFPVNASAVKEARQYVRCNTEDSTNLHYISALLHKAREVQEFETYLLPKNFIISLMKIQGWNKYSMTEPAIVYQAALRSGTNFQVMIHELAREKLIGSSHQSKLEKWDVESLKRKLLDEKTFTDSFNSFNVWHFTERDNGLVFEAGLNDIFHFDFIETPKHWFCLEF